MIREAIAKLVTGESLSEREAAQAMEEIMAGEATPAQFAAFVTALRLKGETVDEITGLASVMRARATRVHTSEPVVDTCGTGGDRAGTFNISTAAALVAAGAGARVAKHGNRAMTSHCGSADVLEALGVDLNLGPTRAAECLDSVGIVFLFAPLYHPAMRHAAAPRQEIGIRTVFNVLGPLTNPAGARAQVLGVAEPDLVEKVALALQRLGCKHALVVHGNDGLDEISLHAPTTVCEVRGERVTTYQIAPEEFGMERVPPSALAGGTADENAALVREVLAGREGPRRQVVLLNAAAALVAADLASDLMEGLHLAADAIDSGRALGKLSDLVEYTRQAGAAAGAA